MAQSPTDNMYGHSGEKQRRSVGMPEPVGSPSGHTISEVVAYAVHQLVDRFRANRSEASRAVEVDKYIGRIHGAHDQVHSGIAQSPHVLGVQAVQSIRDVNLAVTALGPNSVRMGPLHDFEVRVLTLSDMPVTMLQ